MLDPKIYLNRPSNPVFLKLRIPLRSRPNPNLGHLNHRVLNHSVVGLVGSITNVMRRRSGSIVSKVEVFFVKGR